MLSVFREILGLPALPPPVRPRRHRFPTLEYKLPLQFCTDSTVCLDPANIITTPAPVDHEDNPRPKLICPCCRPHLMTKTTITGYWGHIFYAHMDIDNNTRLAEIRRSGLIWEEYLKRSHSHKGKSDPTAIKLEQVSGTGFTWQSVIDWLLRP